MLSNQDNLISTEVTATEDVYDLVTDTVHIWIYSDTNFLVES